ncbi:hypothetical protein [Novosphingobium sp. Leaf2]|uniref:hypothetical protein n=1 Tax=Novosphingobium sp. Leaf2 TaxID=1735670 RepID=UPI0006FFBFED|nr:hypothetical protein [Novosphingobium sp. Leaf2]KQM20162.1 hypothetical protein ASE49_17410 [Novosphingobium sp. Leaf2]
MKIINIDPIVNMVLNPLTHEDAAVAGFRVMHHEAAQYGGLENMLSRSKSLLSTIARLNTEIEGLKAQVSSAQRALAASEKARRNITAEEALKAERAVKQRITETVEAMISGASQLITAEAPKTTRSTPQKVVRRMAASAPRRRSPKLRRGETTDNIVLSLLTNRWKCISTLFREAQDCGFTGTENAIRFAALRLAQAENAIEGRDSERRIAYCRP